MALYPHVKRPGTHWKEFLSKPTNTVRNVIVEAGILIRHFLHTSQKCC
jgi:hypothetical protein